MNVMTKKVTNTTIDGQKTLIVWLFVLATLIFAGGLYGWYQYIHKSPYRVFWGMVDNNLRTYGVTRTYQQKNPGITLEQNLRLALGANNVAVGITNIKQVNENGKKTEITSEVVGTPKANFARYTKINTEQNLTKSSKANLEQLKNTWSKEELNRPEQVSQSVFSEAAYFVAVPYANISLKDRSSIVTFMKDKNVYDVDFKDTHIVTKSGKKAISYKLKINVAKHLEMLKKLDTILGLNQLNKVGAPSEDSAPVELRMIVGIDSRQLLSVDYVGANRTENFSTFGARVNTDLPKANLTRAQLEQKLQDLLSGS